MGRALVLSTASKSSTTGGTFADTLAANTGDFLAVANFETGGAKIVEAWAYDSAHAMEIEVVYTRPDSTHDQTRGFRQNIPSNAIGGAGTNAAFNLLPGMAEIDLQKSDVPTITVTTTASDAVAYSWQTLYDNLPGVSGVFCDWPTVMGLRKSTMGFACNAVASATAGAYGATRVLNADDDRFHADTWYAILGASVQTPVLTISMLGPDWGGQRIGMPAGSLDLRSNTWFVDQTLKWGIPLIPCFNSNNKTAINVQIADTAANTSPKIDFFCYELTTPNNMRPDGSSA